MAPGSESCANLNEGDSGTLQLATVGVRYLDRSVPLKNGVLVQTQSPSITYGPWRSALSAMSCIQRANMRRHVDNMFSGASVFNADLGRWNVASVLTMASMFDNADAFIQSIGSWNMVSGSAHARTVGWAHRCLFPSPPAPRGVHVHVHVHVPLCCSRDTST